MANVRIENSWKKLLSQEFESPYFQNLVTFIRNEYKTKAVFPPAKYIFRALDACPVDQVKVVILGQDPYPTRGHANGLAFSVNNGVRLPGSLQNIFKEIESDFGHKPKENSIEHWAEQGVLLLNTTLTVLESKPASHRGYGWEEFTDAIIKALTDNKKNIVYLLWGSHAQSKKILIDEKSNLILEATHPSPLSAHRGFLGSRHFSKANAYLIMHGKDPIEW